MIWFMENNTDDDDDDDGGGGGDDDEDDDDDDNDDTADSNQHCNSRLIKTVWMARSILICFAC